MNDARAFDSVCGCTALSGEAPKKVIELGPRDNRGVILSVSIKCLRDLCEGATTCLEEGQTLPTGERGGSVITCRVALKESTNKSITLDPQSHLIKT